MLMACDTPATRRRATPTTLPTCLAPAGRAQCGREERGHPRRLAFNRTVVLRYRIHLEEKRLAPATINLRLAAARRIAYEAPDSGLLSPELAAGSRRDKGARLGVRVGNWLTPEQGKTLLAAIDPATLRRKRDRAVVAMLLGCGLRRSELLSVTVKTIQQRQAPLSGRPAKRTKRISEKKAVVSSLFTFMYFRSSTRGRFPLQFDLIVINGGTDEIF
jgi:integrase